MSEPVRVKNVHTGAIASLPESVLQNLPDWVVDDGPPPDVPKPKKNLRRARGATDPASDVTEPDSPDAVPAASTEKE